MSTEDLRLEILRLKLAVKDAEVVMAVIDRHVRMHTWGSRSEIADARLDYCDPGKSRLERNGR